MANSSFSICAYFCWVPVNDTDVYAMGCLSYIIVANIANFDASTNKIKSLLGSKYVRRGDLLIPCLRFLNFSSYLDD